MRRSIFIANILFLPSSAQLLAEANAPAINQGNAAPQVIPGKAKKRKPIEKLDLNQVDLEQMEEDWESSRSQSTVEVNAGIKIQEIVEPTNEYSYASFGKPDPFMAPDLGAPNLNPEPSASPAVMGKEIAVTSPLQNYPITDLHIKGIWQLSSGETRAIVMTPRNEGVVVRPGDPISSGKVLAITQEQVRVRLYRLRTDGVREYEDLPMKPQLAEATDKAVIKLEPGKEPDFGKKPQDFPQVPAAAIDPKAGLPLSPPPLSPPGVKVNQVEAQALKNGQAPAGVQAVDGGAGRANGAAVPAIPVQAK